ncbi:MAG: hypothetical protein RLN70_12095, partial [Rhodospirillaceae bacterium]
MNTKVISFLAACAIGAAVVVGPLLAQDAEPRTVTHSLSAAQYANIIADVFGSDIDLGGRFAPGLREKGLLAVGSSRASITASSMEQFDTMAHAIAGTVTGPEHRELLIP